MKTNRACYEGKKVYGRGKWYTNCYFENANIKSDKYTVFFDCYFFNCKVDKNSIHYNSIVD